MAQIHDKQNDMLLFEFVAFVPLCAEDSLHTKHHKKSFLMEICMETGDYFRQVALR